MENWVIIINPKSGKKQFRQQRKYLFETLKHAGIQFEYRLTEFAGHATKIAKSYAERQYKNFAIVGGDGTISEVINGIFSAEIPNANNLKIALIPRGTGNDWGRFWGLSRNYKHSIDIFLKGKTQQIDIGKVAYTIENQPESHYFINSIGFGLDAKVADVTHKLKTLVGSHSILYTFALLGAVFSYKSKALKINSKEKNLTESMFTMNIANGCYSGGGMKQNPNALPYDGLFDLMLAKKPTIKDIVGALSRLFNGKLLEHPVIESFQTKDICIYLDNNSYFETDGIIVHGTSPYQVTILPNAIQMIVP